MNSVLVILDANYGASITDIIPGTPAWIIDSEVNRSFIQTYWKQHPANSHLEGITIFTGDALAPESTLIDFLDTIFEHHPKLYELVVTGLPITPTLKPYLIDADFSDIEQTPSGFVCRRRKVEQGA